MAQTAQPMDTLTHAAQQHMGDARNAAAQMRAALTRFDLAMTALAAIKVPQTASMRRRNSATAAPRTPRKRATAPDPVAAASAARTAASPAGRALRLVRESGGRLCRDCPRQITGPGWNGYCDRCAADFKYRYTVPLPQWTVAQGVNCWNVLDHYGNTVRQYVHNGQHWATLDAARRNAAYSRHAHAIRTSGYTPRVSTD